MVQGTCSQVQLFSSIPIKTYLVFVALKDVVKHKLSKLNEYILDITYKIPKASILTETEKIYFINY